MSTEQPYSRGHVCIDELLHYGGSADCVACQRFKAKMEKQAAPMPIQADAGDWAAALKMCPHKELQAFFEDNPSLSWVAGVRAAHEPQPVPIPEIVMALQRESGGAQQDAAQNLKHIPNWRGRTLMCRISPAPSRLRFVSVPDTTSIFETRPGPFGEGLYIRVLPNKTKVVVLEDYEGLERAYLVLKDHIKDLKRELGTVSIPLNEDGSPTNPMTDTELAGHIRAGRLGVYAEALIQRFQRAWRVAHDQAMANGQAALSWQARYEQREKERDQERDEHMNECAPRSKALTDHINGLVAERGALNKRGREMTNEIERLRCDKIDLQNRVNALTSANSALHVWWEKERGPAMKVFRDAGYPGNDLKEGAVELLRRFNESEQLAITMKGHAVALTSALMEIRTTDDVENAEFHLREVASKAISEHGVAA